MGQGVVIVGRGTVRSRSARGARHRSSLRRFGLCPCNRGQTNCCRHKKRKRHKAEGEFTGIHCWNGHDSVHQSLIHHSGYFLTGSLARSLRHDRVKSTRDLASRECWQNKALNSSDDCNLIQASFWPRLLDATVAGSVAEMTDSGEDHGDAQFVSGVDDLFIADRAAWLDDRCRSGGRDRLKTVGEGEERIGGGDTVDERQDR